ncbi:hypothetical protein [Tropicibacter alexandrii]|uniref:hypothetical protein n=1 Tax=Tropicibacter alexandrii TaxID=2267683 RepID=UPI000EF4851E|nr:hypothetical protein [Tropicibacter alexandrii]
MVRSHFVILALVALTTTACGRLPEADGTARQQNFLLDMPEADAFWQEAHLTRNAIALEDSIRMMLVDARADGSACSGRILSDPALADCSERQMKAGWMGGLASLGLGDRPLVPERLSPAMADIFARMDVVDEGIAELLIAQRNETVRLNEEHAKGIITRPVYEARLEEMRKNRKVVAETLALGADRAAKARRMLERARSDGQDGLSWYVLSMRQVEERARTSQSRLLVQEG